MLTEEQRRALREETDRSRNRVLTEEELMRYPAATGKMTVPTQLGDTPVFTFESGGKNAERPLIINFHGGGFIKGRSNRDDIFCRRMACAFGALVLDVDYRLAPEYPYPAAVNESWEVVLWAWENRESLQFDPEKVVLMGHSAGGNLVASICMRLGESGLFSPCCALLDYPPLDLAKDPAEKRRTSADMPVERARDYNRKYIRPEQSKEPFASPVYAPSAMLERFPDTLVISAGEDSLGWEDEEFAVMLARSGVTVTLKRFVDSPHGFVMNRVAEWEKAMELIERYVGEHLRREL